MSSAGYAVNWDVIGGGGGPVSSASYAVNGTLGQAVIGGSTNSGYEVQGGYWAGGVAAVPAVTPTPTATPFGTRTPTVTATPATTSTATRTSTATPTGTVLMAPTSTPTVTSAATRTPTATLTGIPPLLCVPALISPEEGAVLDNGRTDGMDDLIWDFDWSDCLEAGSYHLYVIGPGALFPLIDIDTLSDSAYHFVTQSYIAGNNLSGWAWKVRANTGGQWGDWSPARSFDVEPVNTDPARTPTTTPTGTVVTVTPTTTEAPTGTLTVTTTPTATPTGTLTPAPSHVLYLPLVLRNYAVISETDLAYDSGSGVPDASWERGKGFAPRRQRQSLSCGLASTSTAHARRSLCTSWTQLATDWSLPFLIRS